MKVIVGILAVILLIQLIPVNRENPSADVSNDLFSHIEASENVKSTIVGACYDCHSYQTNLPWYTYVAPVSWWLKNHINEGREELNFSIWERV